LLGDALRRPPGWVLSGSLCGWPGGPRHEASQKFLAWAGGYDEGLDVPERCGRLHDEWLAALPCPVVRFLDATPTDEHLERLRPHLDGQYRTGGLP
jgi:hypothetical protein